MEVVPSETRDPGHPDQNSAELKPKNGMLHIGKLSERKSLFGGRKLEGGMMWGDFIKVTSNRGRRCVC